jgi:O-antigen/teichoic acid export membrane protein
MNKATTKKRILGGRIGANLICGGISHLISAVIALVLTPFLIRRLGIEMYGFYPVALEAMAVLGLLMGMLTATAVRYVSVEYAGGRRKEAGRYFSTVFFGALLFSAVLAVFSLLFVIFGDRFLNMPQGEVGGIKLFFALMMLSCLIDAVTSVFGAGYVISGRLDLRAVQELSAVLVKAVLLWFLLSGVWTVSVVSVGVAVLASSVASACIRIWLSHVLVPDVVPRWRDFSRAYLWRVLSSGIWYSVDELGGWLTGGGFLMLVNVVYGLEKAGVYSLSLTAARVFGGVLLMLTGVFVPTVTRQFADGDRDALLADVLRCMRMVGFFALVGISMAVGFLNEFLALWLGAENTPLLRLLCVFSLVPMLAVACALPLFQLSVIMNKLRKMALLYVSGSLLGLAAALGLAVFTEVGIYGVSAVAFAVRVVWYAVCMPFFGARLLSCEPMRLLLPVLRTHAGGALSVGVIMVLKSVCRIDSLPVLIFLMAVSLCAVLVIGFLSVYGARKLKM